MFYLFKEASWQWNGAINLNAFFSRWRATINVSALLWNPHLLIILKHGRSVGETWLEQGNRSLVSFHPTAAPWPAINTCRSKLLSPSCSWGGRWTCTGGKAAGAPADAQSVLISLSDWESGPAAINHWEPFTSGEAGRGNGEGSPSSSRLSSVSA